MLPVTDKLQLQETGAPCFYLPLPPGYFLASCDNTAMMEDIVVIKSMSECASGYSTQGAVTFHKFTNSWN